MFGPPAVLPPTPLLTMAHLPLVRTAGMTYVEHCLLQQERNSHSLASQNTKREGPTLATPIYQHAEIHQPQHQHTHQHTHQPQRQQTHQYTQQHQHQHTQQHQHQHTFSLYTPALRPPATRSMLFPSLLSVGPNMASVLPPAGPFSPLRRACQPKRPRGWYAMHVTIAWQVYLQQQKAKQLSSEFHTRNYRLQQIEKSQSCDLPSIGFMYPCVPVPVFGLPPPQMDTSSWPAAFGGLGHLSSSAFGRLGHLSSSAFGRLGHPVPAQRKRSDKRSSARRHRRNEQHRRSTARGRDTSGNTETDRDKDTHRDGDTSGNTETDRDKDTHRDGDTSRGKDLHRDRNRDTLKDNAHTNSSPDQLEVSGDSSPDQLEVNEDSSPDQLEVNEDSSPDQLEVNEDSSPDQLEVKSEDQLEVNEDQLEVNEDQLEVSEVSGDSSPDPLEVSEDQLEVSEVSGDSSPDQLEVRGEWVKEEVKRPRLEPGRGEWVREVGVGRTRGGCRENPTPSILLHLTHTPLSPLFSHTHPVHSSSPHTHTPLSPLFSSHTHPVHPSPAWLRGQRRHLPFPHFLGRPPLYWDSLRLPPERRPHTELAYGTDHRPAPTRPHPSWMDEGWSWT